MIARGLILSAALAVFTSLALGQAPTTGAIAGVVKDSSGAVVPHATITAQSSALMATRTTTTGSDGSFLISNLPIGTYVITTAATGFGTDRQSGIELRAGFTATINVTLAVGQSQQTVQVTGAPPIVDVKSETDQTTFTTQILNSVPNGRDVWSTLEAAPGITSDRFDVGGNDTYYSSRPTVHGSPYGQMVYSLDGLNLSWPGGNNGSTGFYVDDDAMQEIQAVTDAAPADISTPGIYLNMMSKSGSNNVHGDAAIYYTTAGMESAISEPVFDGAPIQAGLPITMLRDLSTDLGGPIIKNRWWAFGAWRYLITKEANLAVPLPDGAVPIQGNYQSNIVLRNDFLINNANHLFMTWWFNEQNQPNRAEGGGNFIAQQATSRQIEPAYVIDGDWTTSLSPSLVLDTRMGYFHLVFPALYQPTVGPNDIAEQDIVLSTLTGAALDSFVEPSHEFRTSQEANWYLGDFAGTHDVKFGWDASEDYNGDNEEVNQDVVAIYKDNVPFEAELFDGPVTSGSYFHTASAWVQDSWTIRNRLTLNLGVRFDHWQAAIPAQNSPQPLSDFASFFTEPRSISETPVADWNNFSPRLGLAYDLTGHGNSVLRVSYSKFVLSEGTGLAESVNPNEIASKTYLWNGPAGTIPTPAELGQLETESGGTSIHIDPELQRPYYDEINVGYEQQLAGDIRLGVNYYHSSIKNQFGVLNLAAPPSAYTPITSINGLSIINPLTNAPMTLYSLPASLVGVTDDELTNIAAANDNGYNGVEFTAEKRMAKNWMLMTGLTVQRDYGIYTASGQSASVPTTDNFNDPNLNIDRYGAIGTENATYVFKLVGTYDSPLWGVVVDADLQHYTGYPLLPTEVFAACTPSTCPNGPGLNETETVDLEPNGTVRLPNVDQLSFRVSRPIHLDERYTLEPMLDIDNALNSNSITTETATFGPNYLKPSNLLNPRLVRVGLKLSF